MRKGRNKLNARADDSSFKNYYDRTKWIEKSLKEGKLAEAMPKNLGKKRLVLLQMVD